MLDTQKLVEGKKEGRKEGFLRMVLLIFFDHNFVPEDIRFWGQEI